MTRYLIETSVWVSIVRTKPVQPLAQRVQELLQSELVATTGMIRLELIGGAKTRSEFDKLAFVTEGLEQFRDHDSTWLRAARLAFALRRQGVTVPHADILIAAVAIANDATLVHADAHFERIAQHSELKTASYVEYLRSAD